MKTKIIPFDLETAKEIQKGKIKGKIVRNGYEVIILDFNSKKYLGYPIRIAYLDADEVDYVTSEGLNIEVPDNEQQFKPFEKVLVRENNMWIAEIFSHYTTLGNCYCIGGAYAKENVIPYEGNEYLVGTTDKLKEE